MMKHPTFVPKLHWSVPCRFTCNLHGLASREGVELVRTNQLTGDVFEQAQLIVSSILRRGTAHKPSGQRSKLRQPTPRRK